MFTKLETIKIVRDHLLKQAKRAVGKDGLCKYRAEDGSRCAAGCLIPDEEYTEKLEAVGVRKLQRRWKLQDWYGHNLAVVERLQNMHDYVAPAYWEDAFNRLERLVKTRSI